MIYKSSYYSSGLVLLIDPNLDLTQPIGEKIRFFKGTATLTSEYPGGYGSGEEGVAEGESTGATGAETSAETPQGGPPMAGGGGDYQP